jgi:hypothetical protein
MKKFQFDASKRAEVAKALETLKNDTLSSLSAEFVMGGLSVPEWSKTTDWVKNVEPVEPVLAD